MGLEHRKELRLSHDTAVIQLGSRRTIYLDVRANATLVMVTARFLKHLVKHAMEQV